MPIFDDAADEVSKAGYDTGKVVMGKVDCDKEGAIATRFHISKYPTLKLFRNGLPAKKEYRGMKKKFLFYYYNIHLQSFVLQKFFCIILYRHKHFTLFSNTYFMA